MIGWQEYAAPETGLGYLQDPLCITRRRNRARLQVQSSFGVDAAASRRLAVRRSRRSFASNSITFPSNSVLINYTL